MSTLRLTTISNQGGTDSVPSQTVISGSAKAWVNFNGTGTVAIRAGFNVSSITDNGTGNYTVNFTTAFADINYTTVTTNGFAGSGTDWCFITEWTGKATTSTTLRVANDAVSALTDSGAVMVSIFR